MQGINRSRHGHLKDALLQLEDIFSNTAVDVAEIRTKRLELEKSYAVYLELLNRLNFHIASYEDLFSSIKTQCVGNRLKELKKQVQPQSIDSEMYK